MFRQSLLALATLFALPALAAPLPKNLHSKADVEAYIRACEAEWAAVAVTGDPTPTASFIADDYEGVSSKSEVRGRAKLMQPFKPDPNLVSDTLDYVRIRFPIPTLAIAQGGETAVDKNGNKDSLIWTDVWLLRNGRWQIVTSQDSKLLKPYSAGPEPIPTSAAADEPGLVGTWRPVRYENTAADGTVTYPFGEHPFGYFVYDPTGHLSVQLMHNPPIAGPSPVLSSQPVRDDVPREFVAYFGTYKVDKAKGVLHHMVEGALDLDYVAHPDQIRPYRLNGDTLVI